MMKIICCFCCLSVLHMVALQRLNYREKSLERNDIFSDYHYNDAFIEETYAVSLLQCGQRCVKNDCICLTFDLLDGRCRIHSNRMFAKKNGQTAQNVVYYFVRSREHKDCSQVNKDGFSNIHPTSTSSLTVYCEEGWTYVVTKNDVFYISLNYFEQAFQNRFDGSVTFYRDWNAYKTFFGDPNGEYWLGHENIRLLIAEGLTELRVELTTSDGDTYQATYSYFDIADDTNDYRLTVGGYSGNAGDSLTFHNGKPFSTFDRDNDGIGGKNCAQKYKAAWWFGAGPKVQCYKSTLNAEYGATGLTKLVWYGNTTNKAIRKTRMKIRRPL